MILNLIVFEKLSIARCCILYVCMSIMYTNIIGFIIVSVILLGNGKSHYIRSKMSELQCTSIVFPINEGFNIYGCIDELNMAAKSGQECSLHLNFTLPFLKVNYS